MSTTTAQALLGLTDFNGQVYGSTSDAAKDTSKPQYRDASKEPVSRVSNEHADQHRPLPDTRRGGTALAASTTQLPNVFDADTLHDGATGRGPQPAYTFPDWDSSRG